jgi:hypothetical protein
LNKEAGAKAASSIAEGKLCLAQMSGEKDATLSSAKDTVQYSDDLDHVDERDIERTPASTANPDEEFDDCEEAEEKDEAAEVIIRT